MNLRFDPTEGVIAVPTRLWGPEGETIVELALDTGATYSTTSWNLALLLGYDPAIVTDRVQLTTGSGVEFPPRILIEKIEALGQELREFRILCHTLPPSATVDGVLGLDFFPGQRLVVDFRAGTVSLD